MPVLDFPRSPSSLPCFVRLRKRRPDGFIEFNFSIGDPDLAVDLILPEAAYEEFCRDNRVRMLTEAQGAQIDAEQAKWRYGQPGLTE
jgi:phenol/toluene 2-monooxygenase (NADH) P0/A0